MALIIISIIIQFIAAFYAIWLIKKTEILFAWCFISGAIFLMGIRRVISLYRLIESGYQRIDYPMEITGLILSILMLAGVAGIGKIFIEKIKMQHKIEELLGFKDTLLKEVHHRVKNNMSTVSGLLNLQADRTSNETARQAILEARGRMDSMLALYSKLSASGNYSTISMADYMSHLVDEIIKNNSTDKKVTINKDIQDGALEIDTLNYIGIIVNEVITNSMKYAFVEMDQGVIDIKSGIEEGKINIEIKDNGKGINKNDSKHNGFGMDIIKDLVESMNGHLHIENNSGTIVSVSFKI